VAFIFTERAATELSDRITRRIAERMGRGAPPQTALVWEAAVTVTVASRLPENKGSGRFGTRPFGR